MVLNSKLERGVERKIFLSYLSSNHLVSLDRKARSSFFCVLSEIFYTYINKHTHAHTPTHILFVLLYINQSTYFPA